MTTVHNARHAAHDSRAANCRLQLRVLAAAVGMALAQSAAAADSASGSDVKLLGQMTIVGSAEEQAQIAGSARYIDQQELERHDYTDIHRILREVPGVNIQEEEGYGLRPNIGMRGTGVDRSQRITLMEDGVLAAPAPYAAPAAYYFPSAGRMEAVEVRKGSSAIQFGPNTTGGALNLLSTSIPDQPAGRIEFGVGDDSLRRIHAHAGGSGERAGWLLETFQYAADGFKRLDSGGETGFDTKDYLAKLRLNSAPGASVHNELEIKLGAYDELSDETYLGLTNADFEADPYRRYAGSQRDQMDVEQRQYVVHHVAQLSPAVDVTTTLYRQNVARNWYKLDRVGGKGISSILADPTANAAELAVIKGGNSADDALSVKANNREYYSQGVQSMLGWSLNGGTVAHAIEAGLRYHADEEDRFQHVDGYRMDNGTMVQTSAGAPGSDSNRISSARAWAAFVQDTITFGAWSLQPGVRYESIATEREDYGRSDPARSGSALRITEHSVDVWIPGFGLVHRVNPALGLFAGVHRGFTPPAPGSEVDPEESVNVEAGLRYESGALRGEAIAFFNDYSNLLGTCTASSGGGCAIGDQFQAGEVEVKGLEAALAYDFGSARGLGLAVPLRLGYTYTDAQFGNAFVSSFGEWGTVAPGDELPYLPRHQLFAGIGVEHPSWRVDLAVKHVGEMRTVAGQGDIADNERVDSHMVVDFAADYALAGDARAYLTIDNLLDETYMVARRPAGARPGKPRTVMVGMKVDF
jgi:Fe(3+) dicitrate transport protein